MPSADAGSAAPSRVGADDVMRMARRADLGCTAERARMLAPHLADLLASADRLSAAALLPPADIVRLPPGGAVAAVGATPAAGPGPGTSVAADAFLTIRELGRRYRARQLSPVKVTAMLLRRIGATEPRLNAWITMCDESALAEARAAEARIVGGRSRGPLDGVPIACKDNIDVDGISTSCGARILRDQAPAGDAEVVQRLRAAGAVLLGKTNLLEFAYGIVHPDFGQCNNPWDPGRTAGGSSSGSAAAVAAGLAFGSLGTDTGGSIRIPAAYCGVVGLKPSLGRVSTDGVFPLSWTLDHVGPIGRSVDDVALLLAALDGGGVPGAPPPLAGLRAAVLDDDHVLELRPGVARRWEEALDRLAAAGAGIDRVRLPSLEFAESALMQIILPEAAVIHAPWLRDRPEDYALDTRLQLELGVLSPGTAYVAAQLVRDRLIAETRAALADHDVLLSPTVAWVAPPRDPPLADPAGTVESRRTAPHNLTGIPAVTIPCGLGEDGLPVGLQLAGTWGEDRRLLAWAQAVETLLGGPLGPPPGSLDHP